MVRSFTVRGNVTTNVRLNFLGFPPLLELGPTVPHYFGHAQMPSKRFLKLFFPALLVLFSRRFDPKQHPPLLELEPPLSWISDLEFQIPVECPLNMACVFSNCPSFRTLLCLHCLKVLPEHGSHQVICLFKTLHRSSQPLQLRNKPGHSSLHDLIPTHFLQVYAFTFLTFPLSSQITSQSTAPLYASIPLQPLSLTTFLLWDPTLMLLNSLYQQIFLEHLLCIMLNLEIQW